MVGKLDGTEKRSKTLLDLTCHRVCLQREIQNMPTLSFNSHAPFYCVDDWLSL